jgi:Flp pilus assembly protein TadB
MLSLPERRSLYIIERRMRRRDKQFVHKFEQGCRSMTRSRGSRVPRRIGSVMVVLLALIAMLVPAALLGHAGVAFLLVAMLALWIAVTLGTRAVLTRQWRACLTPVRQSDLRSRHHR